jgi:hypothetical protein
MTKHDSKVSAKHVALELGDYGSGKRDLYQCLQTRSAAPDCCCGARYLPSAPPVSKRIAASTSFSFNVISPCTADLIWTSWSLGREKRVLSVGEYVDLYQADRILRCLEAKVSLHFSSRKTYSQHRPNVKSVTI